MTVTPKIGATTFWEMVALTIGGRLASCVSCVEHFYFQSTDNSMLFLESCASAGLLQRMPLLDLFGDVGPRRDPGQHRYDEPIYLSAPAFQAAHAQAARKRLEVTKNAVRSALRLFLEELRADEPSVAAAYEQAVTSRMLRFADIALQRRNVKLSPLAKVRLILDGFRAQIASDEGTGTASPTERDRNVAKQATEFIRGFVGKKASETGTDDVGTELDQFAIEFINSPEKIHDVGAAKDVRIDGDYWTAWLPVVRSLVLARTVALRTHGAIADASALSDRFSSALENSAYREKGKSSASLLAALSDWRWLSSSPETTLPQTLGTIVQSSAEAHTN